MSTSTGTISGTFTVPPSSNGFQPVVADGANSGHQGFATFQVGGFGFGANEQVTVTFNCSAANCTGGTVLGTAQTDGRGDVTLTDLTIPQVATGTYSIGAQGASTGLFARINFTVT